MIKTIYVRKLEENLQIIQQDGVLGIVYGMPGTGKTYTMRHLADLYNWLFITATPTITVKSVCVNICDSLGIDSKGTSVALTKAIIEELQDRNTLLIVDEADMLNRKNTTNVIEHLRIISDLSKTALVFVGTITFEKEVDRGYKRILLEQFNSRVGSKIKMDNLRLLDMYDVFNGQYDKETIKELYRVTRGNFRRIDRVLSRAEIIRQVNKFDKINKDVIIASAEVIGMEVKG